MDTSTQYKNLIKKALQANATFSGVSGVVMIAGRHWFSQLFGPVTPTIFAAIGAGLIVYAGWLVLVARRQAIDVREVWTAVLADLGWVIGTAILLAAQPLWLSLSGTIVAALIGAVVAAFAIVQWYGLKQLQVTKQ